MSNLINDLLELADFSSIQSFFNQRGYKFDGNEVLDSEGTVADELEIYHLARDFEEFYT